MHALRTVTSQRLHSVFMAAVLLVAEGRAQEAADSGAATCEQQSWKADVRLRRAPLFLQAACRRESGEPGAGR